jgi:hypothetical protein
MNRPAYFRPTSASDQKGTLLYAGPVTILAGPYLADEDDIEAPQMMYRIRQSDGTETDAFDDEVTFNAR